MVVVKVQYFIIVFIKGGDNDIECLIFTFAISIRFLKANYLTFDLLLSRNAGDFSGSVDVWVDFFEYLSVKQLSVFQVFAKYVLIWVK